MIWKTPGSDKSHIPAFMLFKLQASQSWYFLFIQIWSISPTTSTPTHPQV